MDLSSGSITITLPLRNKAGKLPFSLGLVTNSVAYLTTNAPGKTAWFVPAGLRPEVLTTNFGASVGYSTNAHYLCGSVYGYLYYGFYVTEATGVEVLERHKAMIDALIRFVKKHPKTTYKVAVKGLAGGKSGILFPDYPLIVPYWNGGDIELRLVKSGEDWLNSPTRMHLSI